MHVAATPAPSAPVPHGPARPAETPSQPHPVATGAAQPQGGARWLAEALHSLRSNHAPNAALALLDRHAAELGRSAFVHEAMLLRVEALLSLKRSDEALDLLDGKVLSNLASSRALLLTRAELRAAAGRWADSLSDFDLLLARAQRPDEQALYGRAVCRSRMGDKLGSQADFELYQRQFPNGDHIGEVQKQLAAAAKSAGSVP
jgi:tetratricopeptide (TPR) repeat protein